MDAPKRFGPGRSLTERLHARIAIDASGCWEWTGANGHGYGQIKVDGVSRPTHRVMWELITGRPIPAGLEIDHLCRNPPCCNPAHLEPVTRAENQRRGVSFPGINARKTHCIRGHEFTPENTYIRNGCRNCRACHRIKVAEARCA